VEDPSYAGDAALDADLSVDGGDDVDGAGQGCGEAVDVTQVPDAPGPGQELVVGEGVDACHQQPGGAAPGQVVVVAEFHEFGNLVARLRLNDLHGKSSSQCCPPIQRIDASTPLKFPGFDRR
jgi:hypothetical protein